VKLRILIASVLSLAAAGFMLAAPSDSKGLVVHEWGTFLAMNGSDGVSLDGMYHEEHALPSFVHARSKDQLRLRMSLVKTETPVIYFYTQQQQRAQVEVGFPTGLWTQWYPQAMTVSPGIVQAAAPPHTRDGRISWDVDIWPASRGAAVLPATNGDALWNYSRDVDAAYVSTSNTIYPAQPREWERFIFYRGLGEAPLPIQVRFDNGRINAATSEAGGLRHLFILRVENGRGAYAYAPSLTTTTSFDQPVPAMQTSLPLEEFVERVSADVARRLTESGLYEKEARAMVNTWTSSYFKTAGVRLLFVMPQSWTDRFIPMRITPAPERLVRVMVGRMELLSPERERRAETAISGLASPDAATRERAFEVLRAEGRYVEPIVRRALRTTTDERVRALSRRLLLTDFVTELRTTFTDAARGERVATEPVYIQAQLASVLREAGLTDEARMEGEAALKQLNAWPKPTMRDHASRDGYRALARAYEGVGNDAEALRWYGEFVQFGSQVAGPTRGCAGSCHVTLGPRDASFFRDWYAGRKFGEYAVRTGEAPRLIAAHEIALGASAGNRASALSLAYLYEATGQEEKAKNVWESVNR
jgi:DNA-binding transcriptional ArsR family regulator